MSPEPISISVSSSALDALVSLRSNEIDRIYVMNNNDLIGVVTQESISKFVEIKQVREINPKHLETSSSLTNAV